MTLLKWIGWCKEDNHDKVWIVQQLSGDKFSGKFVVIWGRRGKKLQTKIHDYLTMHYIERLIDSKLDKGYKSIDQKNLESIYPEFQDDLEKTTVWALLSA
jgi:predicted DNA-binding WGR domain protein